MAAPERVITWVTGPLLAGRSKCRLIKLHGSYPFLPPSALLLSATASHSQIRNHQTSLPTSHPHLLPSPTTEPRLPEC